MDEEAGIDVSQQGFDTQMVEYPHVVKHLNQHFMLYNGNDFGRDGALLART